MGNKLHDRCCHPDGECAGPRTETITPRSFIAARLLRENPDEIRREMIGGGPG